MKEREERDRASDLEQLVRDLQKDLSSREETITRLKEEQFSVASFQFDEDVMTGGGGAAAAGGSPPGSPFVMSPASA